MNRIALALLLFMAACAPESGEHGRAALPRGREVSTHRRPLERVASMDPIQASAVYDSRAVSLVYEPLLEVDYEARPYRLKAGVCDLPDVSADRLAYTFRLRDGVRFQDDPCFPDGKGRLATAEDIVYSLERLRDPKNASSGRWTMDYVQDVKAVDARTVRITLKKPFHVFPWLMAMAYSAVVPHEALEKYGTAFGQHAVGTGPYRLTEWWRNYRMIFTRDAGWRGWAEIANPAPYDKIEYVVVGDLSTQWLMFLGKEVDRLGGVDRNNWEAVVGAEKRRTPRPASAGTSFPSLPTTASQLLRSMPPRPSTSLPRNMSHWVEGSVTTTYSILSYGAGFRRAAHPRQAASRVKTMRQLRHHSVRRYGPVPTACCPNDVPYFSTASCGTTAEYDSAVSQGNTWNGFFSVMFTVRASTASTLST